MAPALTVLAFDYGLARIGAAVGQTLSGSASALETIRVRERRPDWAAITRLVETWRPDHFVIGLPTSADGQAHPLAPAIRKFGQRLAGRFHKPVSFIDERLSSYAAAEDRTETKRAGLDAVAARLILETWFMENTGH